MQTLIRRCVGDTVAGLGLHFLQMSQGPFSCDAGYICDVIWENPAYGGAKGVFLDQPLPHIYINRLM